jgi:hypothetical protein
MPFTILLSGKILAPFLPSQLFFLFRGQNLSPVFTFATLFLRPKAKFKPSFYLRNSFSPSKGKTSAQFLPSQLFFLVQGQNLSSVFTFATLFLRPNAKPQLSFYLRNSFSPSKGKTSAQFLPSQLFFSIKRQNLSSVFTFATLFPLPRAKLFVEAVI